ncbi:MAG: class I SAM-dependent methyltransferase [Chloroflexota bacterium]|nr:class I SAM-dependent methyltransferase [Chloroflexota bacterium]
MAYTDDLAAVWAREREFHDEIAHDIDIDALPTDPPIDRLQHALLLLAGDVNGRRVLDAGCGQGDLTLHLLRSGAQVTALDLSPAMIDVVRRRTAKFARPPTLITAPLEQSELPAASFDLIVGNYVLHHLELDAGGRELARLLRPGGRAIFVENSARNRVLSCARRTLAGRFGIPRLGTADEHPLGQRDLRDLSASFAEVRVHYPVFEFLILFDRQVLRFRYPRVTRIMRFADDLIHRRAPRMRRFSYRALVELGSSGAGRSDAGGRSLHG